MRPGCWSCPASWTSTPIRGWPRTRRRTGSSRIRSRRRSGARPRSSRSTTRAPDRRPPPNGACSPDLREWRAATDADSAIDYGLSLVVSGRMDDPLAELPATIEAGVATSKAFMVFDFRLADRALYDSMALMGARGGMLQVHCEDPVLLDTAVDAALARGDIAPRFHATSPAAVRRGGRDGPGHGLRPSGRCARPCRPPVFGRGARRSPSRPCRRRARLRRDLPALPGAHRRALRRPRSGVLRALRHLAAAPVRGGSRCAVGRAGRWLAGPRGH